VVVQSSLKQAQMRTLQSVGLIVIKRSSQVEAGLPLAMVQSSYSLGQHFKKTTRAAATQQVTALSCRAMQRR
jgi:hypothetical protein